jgi:hypothetical protein
MIAAMVKGWAYMLEIYGVWLCRQLDKLHKEQSKAN